MEVEEVEINKEYNKELLEEEKIQSNINLSIVPQVTLEKDDSANIQNMFIVISRLRPMNQFKEMLKRFAGEGTSKELQALISSGINVSNLSNQSSRSTMP